MSDIVQKSTEYRIKQIEIAEANYYRSLVKALDKIEREVVALANKDLRRTGLVTLFTGIGLAALGEFGLSLDILFGVGLLVMFIGIGQMIAGYVYPNQPDEISDVVESYEKK